MDAELLNYADNLRGVSDYLLRAADIAVNFH